MQGQLAERAHHQVGEDPGDRVGQRQRGTSYQQFSARAGFCISVADR